MTPNQPLLSWGRQYSDIDYTEDYTFDVYPFSLSNNEAMPMENVDNS